jgi:hypothetical protein
MTGILAADSGSFRKGIGMKSPGKKVETLDDRRSGLRLVEIPDKIFLFRIELSRDGN